METAPLCFSCGLPVSTPPRLNDMPDGTPCASCRARALDVVAPALPRPLPAEAEYEDAEQESEFLAADRPYDAAGSDDDRPEPA